MGGAVPLLPVYAFFSCTGNNSPLLPIRNYVQCPFHRSVGIYIRNNAERVCVALWVFGLLKFFSSDLWCLIAR